jgi:predicted DNA-binding transcriptional regulator YafY
MLKNTRKRDRTARLLKVQMLLWQYPGGLEIKDIARKCTVSERTVYRDLKSLESELDVPIWEEGNKWGVAEGHFLPPITFTPAEAMNVFIATRRMQHLYNRHYSGMASTLLKLNTIVPSPIRQQVQNTIDFIDKLPRDDKRIAIFDKLTQAWLSQHSAKILYQENPGEKPVQYIIDPYFIEPVAFGHGIYVLAYSHQLKAIHIYKMQHIVGQVSIEPYTYEIPPDFNVTEYFSSAWNLSSDRDQIKVVLRFNQQVSQSVLHTIMDPSQKTFIQSDGSVLMELTVCNTFDFRSWLLAFGEKVLVVEPEVLRNQIIDTNKAVLKLYLNWVPKK